MFVHWRCGWQITEVKASNHDEFLQSVCNEFHRLAVDLFREEEQGILFCQTVDDCVRAHQLLTELYGEDSVCLNHAQMEKEQRREQLGRFVCGRVRWAVATSVLGRGLDLAGVTLVVHAGPPFTLEEYAQQSGRAARGGPGQVGTCTLFWWEGSVQLVRRQLAEWESRVRAGGGVLGDEVREAGARAVLRLVEDGGCVRSHLDSYLDGAPFSCVVDLKQCNPGFQVCGPCQEVLAPTVSPAPPTPRSRDSQSLGGSSGSISPSQSPGPTSGPESPASNLSTGEEDPLNLSQLGGEDEPNLGEEPSTTKRPRPFHHSTDSNKSPEATRQRLDSGGGADSPRSAQEVGQRSPLSTLGLLTYPTRRPPQPPPNLQLPRRPDSLFVPQADSQPGGGAELVQALSDLRVGLPRRTFQLRAIDLSERSQVSLNRADEQLTSRVKRLVKETLEDSALTNGVDFTSGFKWCVFCFLLRPQVRNDHYTDSCYKEAKSCSNCLGQDHFRGSASCPYLKKVDGFCNYCDLPFKGHPAHLEPPNQCLTGDGKRRSAVRLLAWAWARKNATKLAPVFAALGADTLPSVTDSGWPEAFRTWLCKPAPGCQPGAGVVNLELVFLYAFHSRSRDANTDARNILVRDYGLREW